MIIGILGILGIQSHKAVTGCLTTVEINLERVNDQTHTRFTKIENYKKINLADYRHKMHSRQGLANVPNKPTNRQTYRWTRCEKRKCMEKQMLVVFHQDSWKHFPYNFYKR